MGDHAYRAAKLEVFARPRTKFVASFLGSPGMNFLEARLERRSDQWFAVKGSLATPLIKKDFDGALTEGRAVVLGVRPHDVEVVSGGEGAPLEVSIVEALGAESYAHGLISGESFVARVEPSVPIAKGDTVRVLLRNLHLFDAGSGLSLRAQP